MQGAETGACYHGCLGAGSLCINSILTSAVELQVFTNKEEIAMGVKDELTKSMTGFGYAIIQVRHFCNVPM